MSPEFRTLDFWRGRMRPDVFSTSGRRRPCGEFTGCHPVVGLPPSSGYREAALAPRKFPPKYANGRELSSRPHQASRMRLPAPLRSYSPSHPMYLIVGCKFDILNQGSKARIPPPMGEHKRGASASGGAGNTHVGSDPVDPYVDGHRVISLHITAAGAAIIPELTPPLGIEAISLLDSIYIYIYLSRYPRLHRFS